MAKSVTNSISFLDALAMLRKKTFPNVTILMGEESYYIDALVNMFESLVISQEDRDFNQHVFYGNDVNIETIIAASQQLPVMADKQLVILKEAQSMDNSTRQLEKLASYALRPSSGTVLVIAYKKDALPASSKLIKNIKDNNGLVFNSPAIRDYQLPAHIKSICQLKNIAIEDKAISMLAEFVGSDLSRIVSEIEKLQILKGDTKKTTISTEDVEKNIGISKDYNSFELLRAVTLKDYEKAIRIIFYFETNPKAHPATMTVSLLFNFFSNLVIAFFLPDRSSASVAKALGLKNSYATDDYMRAMRAYNPAQAVNIIHFIRQFDCKLKGIGSYQNEYDLLRELIFKIFTTS